MQSPLFSFVHLSALLYIELGKKFRRQWKKSLLSPSPERFPSRGWLHYKRVVCCGDLVFFISSRRKTFAQKAREGCHESSGLLLQTCAQETQEKNLTYFLRRLQGRDKFLFTRHDPLLARTALSFSVYHYFTPALKLKTLQQQWNQKLWFLLCWACWSKHFSCPSNFFGPCGV